MAGNSPFVNDEDLKSPPPSRIISSSITVTPSHSARKSALDARRTRNDALQTQRSNAAFTADIQESLIEQIRSLQNKEEDFKDQIRDLEGQIEDLKVLLAKRDRKLRDVVEENGVLNDTVWQTEEQNVALRKQVFDLEGNLKQVNQDVETLKNMLTLASEQADASKLEYDELTTQLEASTARYDADIHTMSRKEERLTEQIQELKKENETFKQDIQQKARHIRRLQLDLQEEQNFNSPAKIVTTKDSDYLDVTSSPPISPQKSPIKATFEVETMRASLQHSHQLIKNLKLSLRKAQVEKQEYKKLLLEAQTDIEALQEGNWVDVDSTPAKKLRKKIRSRTTSRGNRGDFDNSGILSPTRFGELMMTAPDSDLDDEEEEVEEQETEESMNEEFDDLEQDFDEDEHYLDIDDSEADTYSQEMIQEEEENDNQIKKRRRNLASASAASIKVNKSPPHLRPRESLSMILGGQNEFNMTTPTTIFTTVDVGIQTISVKIVESSENLSAIILDHNEMNIFNQLPTIILTADTEIQTNSIEVASKEIQSLKSDLIRTKSIEVASKEIQSLKSDLTNPLTFTESTVQTTSVTFSSNEIQTDESDQVMISTPKEKMSSKLSNTNVMYDTTVHVTDTISQTDIVSAVSVSHVTLPTDSQGISITALQTDIQELSTIALQTDIQELSTIALQTDIQERSKEASPASTITLDDSFVQTDEQITSIEVSPASTINVEDAFVQTDEVKMPTKSLNQFADAILQTDTPKAGLPLADATNHFELLNNTPTKRTLALSHFSTNPRDMGDDWEDTETTPRRGGRKATLTEHSFKPHFNTSGSDTHNIANYLAAQIATELPNGMLPYERERRQRNNTISTQNTTTDAESNQDFLDARSTLQTASEDGTDGMSTQSESVPMKINGTHSGIDPRVIEAITACMIGCPMYKYRRSLLGQSNRHERFFWIMPCWQSICWSSDPRARGTVTGGRLKGQQILSVTVIDDFNPNPIGMYQQSLRIKTKSGRDLIISTRNRERLGMWYVALDYLLKHGWSYEEQEIERDPRSNLYDEAFSDSRRSKGKVDFGLADIESEVFHYDHEEIDDPRSCCNGEHNVMCLERRKTFYLVQNGVGKFEPP